MDFRNTRDISVEDGVQKISQMMFRQFGENGFSKEMDIQAQSDGTVRLLSLVPAFYAAMQSGKTVAIDELDHSIHPHLVRELVRYFSSHETNGQLILLLIRPACLIRISYAPMRSGWLRKRMEAVACIH